MSEATPGRSASAPSRRAIDLLEEAALFIEGYAGSADSGFIRQRRAHAWLRDYRLYRETVAQLHQELDEAWFADTIAELRACDRSAGLFPAETDAALASGLALAVVDHFRSGPAVQASDLRSK